MEKVQPIGMTSLSRNSEERTADFLKVSEILDVAENQQGNFFSRENGVFLIFIVSEKSIFTDHNDNRIKTAIL